MIDAGLHRWDAVAPKALVEEAGGRFTNWKGDSTADEADVLATNGKVHAETLAILNGKNQVRV